jgi:two-component system, LytTR family, response regulator
MSERDERDISEQLRQICGEEPETQWKGSDFVFLPGPGCGRLVQVKEISTLEVDGNYTRVTVQGESNKMLVRRSLKACQSRLDPELFVRANRECLVNLSCVKTVSVHDAKRFYFILRDGREIILSRLCSFAFRSEFSI